MSGIADKAMLVQRQLTGWSGRRFDREASRRLTAEEHAESDAARVNKLIVPKALLQPIERHDGEWQRWHEAITLPYPVKGLAILTAEAYMEYADGTSARRARRESLVEELAERLPQALADAPRRLGGLLKPGDVPTVDEVVRRYTCSVVILPFPEASALAPLLGEDAREASGVWISGTVEAAQRSVWERVYACVERMVDRLSAKEADAGARLHASVVGNLRDLVGALPKLNLLADPELERVRARIERTLAIHDTDDLRNDDVLRQNAVDEAQQILEAMRVGGYAC